MTREIDRRDFTRNRVTSARRAELLSRASTVSNRLPGAHRIRITRFDATTGNPTVVASENAPSGPGDYVQRALDHVRAIQQALGFAPGQPAEFAPDPHVQRTSSGAAAVHLQQQYKGVPVFQATEAVRFAPDGTIKDTAGSSVTIDRDRSVSPRVSVQEAALTAARHVAVPHQDEQGHEDPFGEPMNFTSVDVGDFTPKVIATFTDKADQPTVIEAGPFGDRIKANLVWFPLDDDLRLAWEVIITMPNYEAQYRTLVDADRGEILYCRQLVKCVAAQGHVFHVDGGGARQMTSFPRPLADYDLPIPGDLPGGFPDDWVAIDRAEGNGVRAHLGASGPTIQGQLENGVLTFDPADPFGDAQKVLNIFYYNCYLHDFFYLLHFREADGNFQQDNFGRGGAPADPVDARAHSGPVVGTANMATPMDGFRPIMNMGLVTSTNRHTAFDSSVVFHEGGHGLTNRLVGGPLDDRALEAPQSGGMGEGWSDFIACTINDTTVVGSWVVNRARGIRGFPYDPDFPDHFGLLGTGRYAPSVDQEGRLRIPVHSIGEIWCAALMEMSRRVGGMLPVQLVVDALKLTPANPSMLDGRDAILAALDDKRDAGQLDAAAYADARRGIWGAFARFGMGVGAASNGASLSGIVADFTAPAETPEDVVRLEVEPDLAIPDNQPAGVTSTLTVAETGRVRRVAAVSVDIRHTFIGDLRVTLTTPAGSTVVLHDRSGGGADDLVRTYRSDEVAALAAVAGEAAQGDWVLSVSDRAGLDVGTLRRWALEIELERSSQRAVRGEAVPALAIPDDDPAGIGSAIAVAETGRTRGIRVGVDITHTFIGDLRVTLAAPSGQQAILHDLAGGGADNLLQTYDSVSTPALAALIDQDIEGDWTLHVADLAGQDVGKLNRWNLELIL